MTGTAGLCRPFLFFGGWGDASGPGSALGERLSRFGLPKDWLYLDGFPRLPPEPRMMRAAQMGHPFLWDGGVGSYKIGCF
jgi:hypothetical protein